MKTKILIGLIALLFLSSAFADGMWISPDAYLPEPDQKAVISWDGVTEEMILSASTTTTDLENLAWIVPIQSTDVPEIDVGDSAVFELIEDFFPVERGDDFPLALGGMMAESKNVPQVKIFVAKEIGIYDLVVIKADTPEVLFEWMNHHDFVLPQSKKLRTILSYYVDQEDYYLVVNKVDFTNAMTKEEFENIKEIYYEKINKYYYDGYDYYEYDHRHYPSNLDDLQEIGKIIEGKQFTDMNSEEKQVLKKFLVQDEFATPIKVTFKPKKPYFPLVISSASLGTTNIDVYFISNSRALEKNEVLDYVDSITLNDFQNHALGQYVNTEGMSRATKFNYNGRLDALHEDAVFEADVGAALFEPFELVWDMIAGIAWVFLSIIVVFIELFFYIISSVFGLPYY